jgi:hypothetical protein
MNILVTAKDRQVARNAAHSRFERDQEAIGTQDRYTTHLGDEITVGIFGQEHAGQTFSRIYIAQQKHLPAAYSQYLTFHIVPGGRFERID